MQQFFDEESRQCKVCLMELWRCLGKSDERLNSDGQNRAVLLYIVSGNILFLIYLINYGHVIKIPVN